VIKFYFKLNSENIMKKFRDLKVQVKLLSGFIFVSLITLVIGIYSTVKTSEITDLGDVMANKQAPGIMYLGNMSSALNAVGVCERGLLNDEFTRRNLRAAQYKVLNERMDIIKKEEQLYNAFEHSDIEKTKWSEYKEAFSQWRNIGEQFLQLNKEKDNMLARGVALGSPEMQEMNTRLLNTYLDERPYFVKADGALRDLINENWNQISAGNKETNSIEKSTLLYMILLSIAGFVVAISIGLYISKLIVKPFK
jgi:methyl-accepting chemotaxis protein